MKKIITTLLSVSLLAGIGAVATGCGDNPPGNPVKPGPVKPGPYVPIKNDCKNVELTLCQDLCKTTKTKQQCLDKIKVEGRKIALKAVSTDPAFQTLKQEAVKNYSAVAYAAYTDTYNSAKKLQDAVDAFVTYAKGDHSSELDKTAGTTKDKYKPVVANLQKKLEELKKIWIDARPTYLQTEAYRFYDGPINRGNPDPSYTEAGQEAELEPIINPWPMDENYLDYGCKEAKGFKPGCNPQEKDDNGNLTDAAKKCKDGDDSYGTFVGGTEAGGGLYGACDPRHTGTEDDAINEDSYEHSIIGNTGIPLSENTFRNMNTGTKGAPENEEDISTGWHAIEFLLWGQDFNFDGPGHRPATDYLIPVAGHEGYDDANGNNGEKNAARRLDALKFITDMMVKDLKYIMGQWAPGQENYRKGFEADVQDSPKPGSFTKIVDSQYELGIGETGGERLVPAYDQQNQEQEHSCFSDNTDKDFIYDLQGMLNVWNGTYYEWDWTNQKLNMSQKTGDESKSIKAVIQKYEALATDYDSKWGTDYFNFDKSNPPSKVYDDALNQFHVDAERLLNGTVGGASFDRVLLRKYYNPDNPTEKVDNTTNYKRLGKMVDDSQDYLDKAFTKLFDMLGLSIPAGD